MNPQQFEQETLDLFVHCDNKYHKGKHGIFGRCTHKCSLSHGLHCFSATGARRQAQRLGSFLRSLLAHHREVGGGLLLFFFFHLCWRSGEVETNFTAKVT
jgi:hypothetical protein